MRLSAIASRISRKGAKPNEKQLRSFREIGDVRGHRRARQSMRRFVADYAKAMTAFAGEFVHQTSRLFMLQLSSFAAALAQDRPFIFCQFAHRHLLPEHFAGRMPALHDSLALEFRFSLFKKSFHAFVLVCAGEAEREEIDFAAQAFVEI